MSPGAGLTTAWDTAEVAGREDTRGSPVTKAALAVALWMSNLTAAGRVLSLNGQRSPEVPPATGGPSPFPRGRHGVSSWPVSWGLCPHPHQRCYSACPSAQALAQCSVRSRHSEEGLAMGPGPITSCGPCSSQPDRATWPPSWLTL